MRSIRIRGSMLDEVRKEIGPLEVFIGNHAKWLKPLSLLKREQAKMHEIKR